MPRTLTISTRVEVRNWGSLLSILSKNSLDSLFELFNIHSNFFSGNSVTFVSKVNNSTSVNLCAFAIATYGFFFHAYSSKLFF